MYFMHIKAWFLYISFYISNESEPWFRSCWCWWKVWPLNSLSQYSFCDHCPCFLLLRSFQLLENVVILNLSGSQACWVWYVTSGQLEQSIILSRKIGCSRVVSNVHIWKQLVIVHLCCFKSMMSWMTDVLSKKTISCAVHVGYNSQPTWGTLAQRSKYHW